MYLVMHPCDMMQVLNNYDVILQCMYVPSYPDKQPYIVFLPSDTAATIYFAARFVRLLFEGGYYSRAGFISFENPKTSMMAG